MEVVNMAGVVDLNGQVETFAIVNNFMSNDDDYSKDPLHVNKVVSSSNSCHVKKTCPLMGNGSSKLTADVTADPGYVIKASTTSCGMKVFVNVCKNECIEKPSSAKEIARSGRAGLSWTVPHTLTEQVTNSSQHKQAYRVFDFQVHPDTYRMAETNNRFKHMLNELAIGAVAREFNVHLNVRKLQFPKMKYKEVQVTTRNKDAPVPQNISDIMAEVSAKEHSCSKQQNIEPSVDSDTSKMSDWQKAEAHAVKDVDADIDPNNNKFVLPKYVVKFSASEELPVVNGVTFSRILVVDIQLPLVNSALAVNLDVSEKSLYLMSTGAVRYKLEIDLPCVVDENCSFAKFIKSRRVLHVMMPELTSSNTMYGLSDESSSASHAGQISGSERCMIREHDHDSTNSVAAVEIASGQKADLRVSTVEEHAADASVNCLTNVDSCALQFSYRQDLETVSIIFSINDVVPSSVFVNFISDSMCKIEMDKGAGDGGDLTHMCCFLKVDDNCKFKDHGGYTVDVTDVSVVLVIAKASQCHHMWNTFWTGSHINHLEKRQFLTSACLMNDVGSSNIEHCERESDDKSALAVQVNSVGDNKLVVTAEESRKSNKDASSEIVVVHEKGVPKLHGILKQRTVSESSDDGMRAFYSGCDRQMSTTTGSEGDDNEDSPDRSAVSCGGRVLRKSVSFNEHIDRTLFQANQSVSSMHATLKNRRRRARKRDQKQEQKEQRRRRRSSGSFSLEESGDEQTASVQAECLHVKSDGNNSHASGADTKDSSSLPVTGDEVDSSCSDTICYAAEITDDVSCFESSSENEIEKPTQSMLQKSKPVSNETVNENFKYYDAFRTKSYLEGCGSQVIDDGVTNLPDVCDSVSSLHVFDGENCECNTNSVDVTHDGDEIGADGDISQPIATCCSPDSSVEIQKLAQTGDNMVSMAGGSENVVVLHKCSLLDLDVD